MMGLKANTTLVMSALLAERKAGVTFPLTMSKLNIVAETLTFENSITAMDNSSLVLVKRLLNAALASTIQS